MGFRIETAVATEFRIHHNAAKLKIQLDGDFHIMTIFSSNGSIDGILVKTVLRAIIGTVVTIILPKHIILNLI